VKLVLPIAVLLSGCVVKQYGTSTATMQAEQGGAPVDFSSVEAQLEQLITAERENVDRRDRLEAAWELLQRVKTARPTAQQAVEKYLTRLITLEKRGQDGGTDAVASVQDERFTPIAAIQGEEIEAAPAPEAAPDQALLPASAGGEDLMESARIRMNAGDLPGALSQLEVCRGLDCWTEVQGLWGECRDRWVYQEVERAGRMFLAVRALKDKPIVIQKMQETRDILSGLQVRYPGSRYSQGISDKITRVDAAIAEASAE